MEIHGLLHRHSQTFGLCCKSAFASPLYHALLFRQRSCRFTCLASPPCSSTVLKPSKSAVRDQLKQDISEAQVFLHDAARDKGRRRVLEFNQPETGRIRNGERFLTALDVAWGIVDVYGWTVEVEGKGEVGKVAEIIHIGRAGSQNDKESPHECLLRVCQPFLENSGESTSSIRKRLEHSLNIDEEILIPIVDEFMQHVDYKRRRLIMKPPDGLLELAKRPGAIRRLHPEIKQFCKHFGSLLKERFSRNKKIRWNSDADIENYVQTYMPTREQLLALGRYDLVRRIKDAGGFLFVAHSLGLKTTRRPNGYWDDLEKLDTAVELFIWESWVKRVHSESGVIYYENTATKQVALDKLAPKIRHGNTLIDCETLRIMPQKRAFWKAGRWDLHHAIVWNGGYREVSQALGRKQFRSRKSSDHGPDIITLLLQAR